MNAPKGRNGGAGVRHFAYKPPAIPCLWCLVPNFVPNLRDGLLRTKAISIEAMRINAMIRAISLANMRKYRKLIMHFLWSQISQTTPEFVRQFSRILQLRQFIAVCALP